MGAIGEPFQGGGFAKGGYKGGADDAKPSTAPGLTLGGLGGLKAAPAIAGLLLFVGLLAIVSVLGPDGGPDAAAGAGGGPRHDPFGIHDVGPGGGSPLAAGLAAR